MLYGILSIIIILFAILAPSLLFSTLNPIIEHNSVLSASLKIKLSFNNHKFLIFDIETAEETHDISEFEWQTYNLNKVSEILATYLYIMQKVTMPIESDKIWDLSPHGIAKLCNFLSQRDMKSNIESSYLFIRTYPTKYKRVKLLKQQHYRIQLQLHLNSNK